MNLLNYILAMGPTAEARYRICVTSPIGLILVNTSYLVFGWLSGTGAMFDNSLNEWTICGWWHLMIRSGRLYFFVVDATPSDVDAPEFWSFDTIFGVTGATAYLHRRLWGTFTDLFIVMNALTPNVAARSFVAKIKAGSFASYPWDSIHSSGSGPERSIYKRKQHIPHYIQPDCQSNVRKYFYLMTQI